MSRHYHLSRSEDVEECENQHSGVFTLTGPLKGYNEVHQCTKPKGHWGDHKDEHTDREWS